MAHISNIRIISVKYIVLIITMFPLFSCRFTTEEEYYKTYDFPLIKENEKIRLSGDYKQITELNLKYYKDAQKKGYEEGMALCYINLAFTNSITGNCRQSLFLLEKAESILKNTKSKLHLAWLYDGYSDLNYFLELYQNALNYNNQAFQSIADVNDSEIKTEYLARFYIKRGQILFGTNDYKAALNSFHKAETIRKQAYSAGWIANLYVKTNQRDSAAYYIKQAQSAMDREKLTHYNIQGGAIYFFSGNYYSLIGDYKEAEGAYLKALKINTETKNIYRPLFAMAVHKAMANLYEKDANFDKACFYRTQYSLDKDDFYKKQKEVINLTTEKFISEIKKSEQKERHRIQLLMCCLILATFTINVYTFSIIRKLKIRKKMLQDKARSLERQIDYNKFSEIIELAKRNHSTFLVKFEELYPDFTFKLKKINPQIEASEIAFCAMIKLNFSSKEIAAYTYIQHASVQQRKRRIRKKLKIASEVDLYQFFNNL